MMAHVIFNIDKTSTNSKNISQTHIVMPTFEVIMKAMHQFIPLNATSTPIDTESGISI